MRAVVEVLLIGATEPLPKEAEVLAHAFPVVESLAYLVEREACRVKEEKRQRLGAERPSVGLGAEGTGMDGRAVGLSCIAGR